MKRKIFRVGYIFTDINRTYSYDDYLKIFLNSYDTKYGDIKKLRVRF